MTTTPLSTIAEALIEFILSLLRDPAASQEFLNDPEGSMARAGLADVCAEDVRAVAPVVIDHPDVVARPVSPTIVIQTPEPHTPVQPPVYERPPEVVREISNIANNFHVDNRSTIVDQSVNQNIWAEGDVTQLFDQEAVIAVGDKSTAAGDDALLDESNTDVTIGDVAIGNTDTDVTIDDSFNDESTDVDLVADTEIEDSLNDQSTDVDVDTEIEDSFNDESTTAVAVADESFNDQSSEVEVEVDDSFNDTETTHISNTESTEITVETVEAEPVEMAEPVETEAYEPLLDDELPLDPEIEEL